MLLDFELFITSPAISWIKFIGCGQVGWREVGVDGMPKASGFTIEYRIIHSAQDRWRGPLQQSFTTCSLSNALQWAHRPHCTPL